ncbi:MATE family efflux transporter [Erysipelothrix urinaevulpis]|uniref:MATE family efflux transporter n=1 Tax=Erysipelothrix urinaevulpis TaxID=2683717 RepID=UPI0019150C13|nr:MATE family efflux transporter [Erysipelothrix urinaevulpis]
MNSHDLQNKLSKTILVYSIPSIIAMLLTSSVSLVDGYFIGNYVSEDALAAINMGLPILYLYLGVGLMISVGGIAIAGRYLGANNIEKSNQVFNQTFVTALLSSIFVSLLFFIFLPVITRFLNPTLQGYFKDYYLLMLLAYPMIILITGFGMFIRAEGKPQFIMFVNAFMLLINIILDYIFTLKLELGIKGVAYASIISLSFGMILLIYYILKLSTIFKFKKTVFDRSILRETLLNGASEFIGQMSMVISMLAFNVSIMNLEGVQGIAAFTVVGYLSYIFNMIVIGFGQGASPLISFSFGANEKELSMKIRKKTTQFVSLVAFIMILIVYIFNQSYATFFVNNQEIVNLIRPGLKLFVLSFIFAGLNTLASFYFTSIGKAKESAIISFARGLGFLLLAILILPRLFQMNGIWLVPLVTEFLTSIIVIYYLNNDKRSISF